MSPSDFWNLAGRAGRWGKEFQGNIVCVDPRSDVWVGGIPEKRVKHTIESTAQRIMTRAADIVTFIDEGTPREMAAKAPDLESFGSYLAASAMKHGSIGAAPIGRHLDNTVSKRLDRALSAVMEGVELSEEIVLRNPGISPLAMQSLLDYFRLRDSAPHELVPVLPESEDAAQVYTQVFHRINAQLAADAFGRAGRVFQCALLVVNWMRGYPLARLIVSWINYLRRKGRTYAIASEIRKTMQDVDQVARYRAPKYLSCYVDVLTFFCQETGQVELLGEVPDLNVLLEFGVSQKTQVSLMSLGLSRTATIAVSELIADDNLEISDVLKWLQEQEWDAIDLPRLTRRDIVRCVSGVS